MMSDHWRSQRGVIFRCMQGKCRKRRRSCKIYCRQLRQAYLLLHPSLLLRRPWSTNQLRGSLAYDDTILQMAECASPCSLLTLITIITLGSFRCLKSCFTSLRGVAILQPIHVYPWVLKRNIAIDVGGGVVGLGKRGCKPVAYSVVVSPTT